MFPMGRKAIAIIVGVLMAPFCAIGADQAPSFRPLEYIIDCEGCHKADGSGQPGIVPAFTNHVSSYLHVPAGRGFLIGVPGVSQSALNDEEIAKVMNWLVKAYDPQGMPGDFKPFTATEVETLRRNPISDTIRERLKVENQLASSVVYPRASVRQRSNAAGPRSGANQAGGATSMEQPAAFDICAACHPVSPDGANGMGPNLHGIVGRLSGKQPGFTYSKSMQTAAIVWTEDALYGFIESPLKVVPNTSMSYTGEPNPSKRLQILSYLKSLN